MGLEEHLLHMFRDDFEFHDAAGPSHHGGHAPRAVDAADREDAPENPEQSRPRQCHLARRRRKGAEARSRSSCAARPGATPRFTPPSGAFPKSASTRSTRQRPTMRDDGAYPGLPRGHRHAGRARRRPGRAGVVDTLLRNFPGCRSRSMPPPNGPRPRRARCGAQTRCAMPISSSRTFCSSKSMSRAILPELRGPPRPLRRDDRRDRRPGDRQADTHGRSGHVEARIGRHEAAEEAAREFEAPRPRRAKSR